MHVPEKFENVTVRCKANLYFDGKVVSHAVCFADGSEKTIGLIYAGTYHFGTGAPERMEVVSGACSVKLAETSEWREYKADAFFDVPGNSSFDITVSDGIMEYICSYG